VGGFVTVTANHFLEDGASTVWLDCDAAGIRRIERELPAPSGTIAYILDSKAVDCNIKELNELPHGLDIFIIKNCGSIIRQPFKSITPEPRQKAIDINLNGIFCVAQQAARRMMADGARFFI
jgi:NADP-dependent 3-hydroxy acid dehydrogenase YdfG